MSRTYLDHNRRFSAAAQNRRDEFAEITGEDFNSAVVNRLVAWAQDFANKVRDDTLSEAATMARELTTPVQWHRGDVTAHRHPSPIETQQHILAAREKP